jgi:hypothetical protein
MFRDIFRRSPDEKIVTRDSFSRRYVVCSFIYTNQGFYLLLNIQDSPLLQVGCAKLRTFSQMGDGQYIYLSLGNLGSNIIYIGLSFLSKKK